MANYKDRYALITGASSGIGYEFTKLLAKDGINLIIVSRSKNKLEQVKAEIENKYRVKIKILPKSYILYFSEALANELQGSGVSVTCLCPGRTRTQLFKRANIEISKRAKGNLMDPATVAKAGYTALKKGKVIVIPGLKNKLLVFSVRIAPRNIVTKITRLMLEKEILLPPSNFLKSHYKTTFN